MTTVVLWTWPPQSSTSSAKGTMKSSENLSESNLVHEHAIHIVHRSAALMYYSSTTSPTTGTYTGTLSLSTSSASHTPSTKASQGASASILSTSSTPSTLPTIPASITMHSSKSYTATASRSHLINSSAITPTPSQSPTSTSATTTQSLSKTSSTLLLSPTSTLPTSSLTTPTTLSTSIVKTLVATHQSLSGKPSTLLTSTSSLPISSLTTPLASSVSIVSEKSTWISTESSRTLQTTLPTSKTGSPVVSGLKTPPTSSSPSMMSASSHHPLAASIIIGAVIGGVLLVAALGFILFRCYRKHASRTPTSHHRHHSNSFGSNILTLSNIPGLGHVSEGNYAILSDPPMSSYGPPSPIPHIQRAPSPLTPEFVPASRGHKSLNVGVDPGVESKRTSARTHRSYTTRSLNNSDESHLTLPAYFSELGFRL